MNNDELTNAIKAMEHHLKFTKGLLKHLKGQDEVYKNRALWASWCLHHYVNEGLMLDIKKAMSEQPIIK